MIELLIAYKWPIFLVIITSIFKTPLTAVINALINLGNKAKTLTYNGFNIELGSSQHASPIGDQQKNEAQFLDLQKAYQSSIITNEEQIINNQINDAKLTPVQAKSVLTTHLANANFIIKMLRIDKVIFNEQIYLLSFLNKQYKASTEHELLPFYEQWLEKSKNSEYTFPSFLSFLLNERLIAQDLNGYHISVMGREFLAFLVRTGRSICIPERP